MDQTTHSTLMPTITIAIITYNRPQLLLRCLDSFRNQTKTPDTIVIIDSSALSLDPATIPPIAGTSIRYFHFATRASIPVARNLALGKTETDLICFIDDDATAEPAYVETIIKSFIDNPGLGGVTGPTIDATAEKIPLNPLIRDTRKRFRVLPWGEIRSAARKWIPLGPVLVDGMQGGNMSYRTADLHSIGGFDELFIQPSFREESDVQMRLKKIGKGSFLYHPQIFVYHMPEQRGGISDFEDDKSDYYYRAGKNHRRFSDKHFPKILSRLSWIFWSRTPTAIIWCPLLALKRGKAVWHWHRGLWESL